MGRIVVTEFVALDGVMEDPGGSEGTRHAGWSFETPRDDVVILVYQRRENEKS